MIESSQIITVGPTFKRNYNYMSVSRKYIGLDLFTSKEASTRLVYDADLKKTVFEESPFFITIAHELIHADFFIRGINKYYRSYGTREYFDADGKRKPQDSIIEEYEVVGLYDYICNTAKFIEYKELIERARTSNITENQIRKEQKLKERVKY